jgi:hypothetical protein
MVILWNLSQARKLSAGTSRRNVSNARL